MIYIKPNFTYYNKFQPEPQYDIPRGVRFSLHEFSRQLQIPIHQRKGFGASEIQKVYRYDLIDLLRHHGVLWLYENVRSEADLRRHHGDDRFLYGDLPEAVTQPALVYDAGRRQYTLPLHETPRYARIEEMGYPLENQRSSSREALLTHKRCKLPVYVDRTTGYRNSDGRKVSNSRPTVFRKEILHLLLSPDVEPSTRARLRTASTLREIENLTYMEGAYATVFPYLTPLRFTDPGAYVETVQERYWNGEHLSDDEILDIEELDPIYLAQHPFEQAFPGRRYPIRQFGHEAIPVVL